MKNKSFIIFLLTIAFVAQDLAAQETRPINLAEAVDLSVKNSKQLKISKAKIDAANAQLVQAEQKKLPDVSVSGSYLRLTAANVDVKTKSQNSGSGSGSGNTNETPSVTQAAYGILNASLPLYAGGRVRYGIASAQFLSKAAMLDAENDRDDVVQNTIEAYVNLFKSRSAVEIVQDNLDQARARVKDLSNLEQNGLLARNDLMKAELQASNIELSLLDAQNNWQLANVNMNLMLGLPEKTILVPDSSMLLSQNKIGALDDYLQAAGAGRKDIASLDLKKEAALTGVKSVKAERLPSISLTGGYIAADIPKVLTITNAANIGVGVSYNLASLWKNKAKVQEAQARASELSATQEMVLDQVRLQINKAYLDLLSSEKKIDVYQKAIEQANENYRIVNNKYKNSLATTTDLLEADIAQLQAKLNYTFARADAVVSYNQLLRVSGQQAAIK